MLLRGWLAGAALIFTFNLVNILSVRHDMPHLGWLPPTIWETSSALSSLVVFLLPWALVCWARRRDRSWPVLALVLALAAPLYSALHVGGFVLLRKLAYRAVLGEPYDFGPIGDGFVYEFRKDLLGYGIMLAAYWLAARLDDRPAVAAAAAPPSVFDIRDGARIVRAPVVDILAVRAVGNYAEFVLADGRRPMTRSSLSALEAQLAGHGFLRTHRSWLINRLRVTGLEPGGSGDYAVELGSLRAPLSRRYPEALAALRG